MPNVEKTQLCDSKKNSLGIGDDKIEYALLKQELLQLRTQNLKQLFVEDPLRHREFFIETSGIQLDYSFQPINKEVLFLLTKLALKSHLNERITDLFSGNIVNHTERRPALHTALRADEREKIWVDGIDVNLSIQQTLERMRQITQDIHSHIWRGCQNSPITDVVNIGIGGSDLGPKMAVRALKKYQVSHLRCHFVSDGDPDGFDDAIEHLNPETTLFIVTSKSFTTAETLLNLKKALDWFGPNRNISQHFIAITNQIDRPRSFGIQHVLPIWDWVGGRYSFFSAVNLILMLYIGPKHFSQLLAGGRAMDNHFRTAPFACNMPVMMALLGIWNLNFLHANNQLILIYSKRLNYFLPYVQQLDMESNGKSLGASGVMVDYSTGPIVWGGQGNHAEHAFYQLLYQGSHYIPADCIFLGEARYESMNHVAFKKLNFLAFRGKQHEDLLPLLPGQSGINKIILKELKPETLGALVALYEHKIYCQSVIWNINAFDQPGVDSAKSMPMLEV